MKAKKETRAQRLTERQAWLVIAAMFNYPPDGMCAAIGKLEGEGLLAGETAQKMFNRIERALRRVPDYPDRTVYLFPARRGTTADYQRIEYARRAAKRATR